MRSPYEVNGLGGSVAFDGAFVALRHTGFLGRSTVGKGEKRIPIQHITAIQMKPAGAVVSGFIQFTLGGGVERRSQFGRQSWDAAGDENSVMFTRAQQPEFERLRSAIERQISLGAAPVAGFAPALREPMTEPIPVLAAARAAPEPVPVRPRREPQPWPRWAKVTFAVLLVIFTLVLVAIIAG